MNKVKPEFLYMFLNYVYLLVWCLNSSGGVGIAATVPLFPASLESSRVGAKGHPREVSGVPGRLRAHPAPVVLQQVCTALSTSRVPSHKGCSGPGRKGEFGELGSSSVQGGVPVLCR